MKKIIISLLLASAMLFGFSTVSFAAEEISPEDALAADDAIIIDVRHTDTYYADGYVDGSIHLQLFTEPTSIDPANLEDDLSKAFLAYVNKYHAELEGKPIYVLCNSGSRGAEKANALLEQAGLTGITITGGAKALKNIEGALVKQQFTKDGEEADVISASKDKNSNIVILNVRKAASYDAGHLKNAINVPVFGANGASNGYDEVADSFLAGVKANADALNKADKIYVMCNGGASGAKAATKLLMRAGYSNSKIVTVTKGYSNPEITKASIYVSPSYALTADGTIIDVRHTDNYYAGYVDGSIHLQLFTEPTSIDPANLEDDLSKAFLAYSNKYKAELAAKPIYILCNSGSRGAEKANILLDKVGLSGYIIEGGAGALKNIDGALVKQQFTAEGEEAALIAATKDKNSNIVILNVRKAANYDVGHLKGAINVPVFGANGASNGYDEVADSFLAGVKANADKLKNAETIYVMCNGGASGAKAATKLLMRAGYSNSKIVTVTKGYSNPEITKASIYVSSAQALSVIGNEKYVILDVRKASDYEAGHLKGSLSAPLFNDAGVTNGSDDLAKAFTDFVTGNKDLEGKTIYVLCNSGSRGAENATILLNAAGYTDVWTIDGGFNLNQDIQDATKKPVVDDTNKEEDKTDKAPATGDTTPVMMYAIVMLACATVIVSRRKIFK